MKPFIKIAFMMILLYVDTTVATRTAFSQEEQEFIYMRSELSGNGIEVKKLLSGQQIAGCAAMDTRSKPEIFLMKLSDGSGTTTLIGKHYKISAGKRVAEIKLRIGSKNLDKIAVMDGNSATIPLTAPELEQMTRSIISVNGVALNAKIFNILYQITSECISSQ